MKLTFYGGAQSVTGANYLLEVKNPKLKGESIKILIDCGLNQGSSVAERKNFEKFSYNPGQVDYLLITHAHIDHVGRAPKLIKEGFEGKVYSTPPTKDFAKYLLFDSQHLLLREAERLKKSSIYDEHHIDRLLQLWEGVEYEKETQFGKSGVSFVLHSAGHILGSASIEIRAEGKTILFSGDLGNTPEPLIGPPAAPCAADYCLIEAAYGDRIHEDLVRRKKKLEETVVSSVKAGGTLMIPAFALERTQILLLELKSLFDENKIGNIPIFLDSPLAIKLTNVYNKYKGYFKPEVREQFETPEKIFDFPLLKKTLLREESMKILHVKGPKIVIAGSGMSTGGRILHHEKNYLSDPNSTLLIFGYQAEGTLGRTLLNGGKEVKIMGEQISVKARVRAIGAYSAHADQSQLLKWAEPLKKSLKKMFVVQGELGPSQILAEHMQSTHQIQAVVPKSGQSVQL